MNINRMQKETNIERKIEIQNERKKGRKKNGGKKQTDKKHGWN